LIGQYIRLEKRGTRYWGLCPFHSEKTPSFSVVPEKQFYHCFGCKASGDVFRFLMEKERLDFREALRFLADRAGMAMPQAERTPAQERAARERAQVYDALEFAARFFHYQLVEAAHGREPLAYLQ